MSTGSFFGMASNSAPMVELTTTQAAANQSHASASWANACCTSTRPDYPRTEPVEINLRVLTRTNNGHQDVVLATVGHQHPVVVLSYVFRRE